MLIGQQRGTYQVSLQKYWDCSCCAYGVAGCSFSLVTASCAKDQGMLLQLDRKGLSKPGGQWAELTVCFVLPIVE